MTLSKIIQACALVVCTSAAHAEPRTWYVSDSIGNDAGRGIDIEPFQTVSYAVSQAEDGDTIQLGQGDYTCTDRLRVSKSLDINGTSGVKIRCAFVISSGEVRFKDIDFVQAPETVVAQFLVTGGAVLRLTDITAVPSAGQKPFLQMTGASAYISSVNRAVNINYNSSPSKDVIQVFYNSYLWIGQPGTQSMLMQCKDRCIYAASSIVTWLEGTIRGVGASSTILILANRMSRVFVHPVAIVQNAAVGVLVENGSDAYVPSTVTFTGVTTPRKMLSGGTFK